MSDYEDLKPNERYLLSLCDATLEICMPIFNHLLVRYFRYVKSYKNGDKIILCTNPYWLEQYFKDQFYDTELANFHRHPDGTQGISIHGTCHASHPVCQFWNKHATQCNYNHVLAMYEKFDDYFELYDFGLKQDSHAANNIFLNNPKVFNQFIIYFRSKAKILIENAEKGKFKSVINTDFNQKENWMRGIDKDAEAHVMKALQVNNMYLDGHLSEIFITQPEALAAMCFIKGMSFEKAAKVMKVEVSVYELALASMINKLGASSKDDLRALLFKNGLYKKILHFAQENAPDKNNHK